MLNESEMNVSWYYFVYCIALKTTAFHKLTIHDDAGVFIVCHRVRFVDNRFSS